jgi:hypothetical protein
MISAIEFDRACVLQNNPSTFRDRKIYIETFVAGGHAMLEHVAVIPQDRIAYMQGARHSAEFQMIYHNPMDDRGRPRASWHLRRQQERQTQYLTKTRYGHPGRNLSAVAGQDVRHGFDVL